MTFDCASMSTSSIFHHLAPLHQKAAAFPAAFAVFERLPRGDFRVFQARNVFHDASPLVRAAEALADDFARVHNQHERVGVNHLDVLAQHNRLVALHHRHQHRAALVRVRAFAMQFGRAALEHVRNILLDFARFGGNDVEVFMRVDVFQHHVHQQALYHQTEDAEQPGFHAERDARHQGDDEVAAHQRAPDVEAGVLAQNHGDNVRAAGGRVEVEENRRADRGQADSENQLHEGLGCHRRVHRNDALQPPRQTRHQQADIRRASAEALAEHNVADDEQQNVDHHDEIAIGEIRNIMAQNDRHTADAAGGKMVRKLEEVDAQRHNHRAERQQCIKNDCKNRQ